MVEYLKILWSEAKYTHNRDSLKNPIKHRLNINNEKQDCKIVQCTWWALVGGGGGMEEMKVREYG
jgi:hypothetical protein